MSSLPRFGVGSAVKRVTWRRDDCFWAVQRVKPSLVRNTKTTQRVVDTPRVPPSLSHSLSVLQDGTRGKAWGVKVWDGVPGKREEIRGTLKTLWRHHRPPAAAAAALAAAHVTQHVPVVGAEQRGGAQGPDL